MLRREVASTPTTGKRKTKKTRPEGLALGSRFSQEGIVGYLPVWATGWPGIALRGSFLSRIAVL
jgi:hypothetical protein